MQRSSSEHGRRRSKFAERLNNFDVMLDRRFERMGRIEDLEEAIRITRRAVTVIPNDHPDLAN
jgi:hypothetical protein